MKKLIAILLAAAMCLSLAACGGGESTGTDENNASAEKAIIGEWKSLSGATVTFNEDGTGTAADGNDMSWKYNAEKDCYILTMTFSEVIRTWECELKNEDGIRSLSIGDSIVYHADDYEKAVEANK